MRSTVSCLPRMFRVIAQLHTRLTDKGRRAVFAHPFDGAYFAHSAGALLAEHVAFANCKGTNRVDALVSIARAGRNAAARLRTHTSTRNVSMSTHRWRSDGTSCAAVRHWQVWVGVLLRRSLRRVGETRRRHRRCCHRHALQLDGVHPLRRGYYGVEHERAPWHRHRRRHPHGPRRRLYPHYVSCRVSYQPLQARLL